MRNLIAWLLEPFYFKTFMPWLQAMGGIWYGGGKGDSDPPNYKPLADASKEAAKIGAELGREQLAENQRQYDQNMAVAAPVIQAQTGLLNQQIQQGDDYYNYMRTYGRPVEQSLFFDALGLTDDEDFASQFEELNANRNRVQQEFDIYQADKSERERQAAAAPKPGVTYGQGTKIIYKDGSYTPQELLSLANSGDAGAAKALKGAGFDVEKSQIGSTVPVQRPQYTGNIAAFAGVGTRNGAAEQPISAFTFKDPSSLDKYGTTYTSGDEKLDAYLANAGIKYQEPSFSVSYATTSGGKNPKQITKSSSVDGALSSLNSAQSSLAAELAKKRPNQKTVASLQAQIGSISGALNEGGYSIAQGEDGKYAFSVDPNKVYADKTREYRTQWDAQVEQYREQLGLKKEEVVDPRDARDWQGELSDNEAQINSLSREAQRRMDAKDAAERDQILGLNTELASRLGETDVQVYSRNANDIEAEAGQAVADSRAGFTNAINVAARQGLRYGFSPAKLAAMASQQSVQQAAQQAAAANTTRKATTTTMYNRGVNAAQQGLTGAATARSMKQQDKAIQTARKLDVAGLYRGLPGASQGSYSLATNAGNSAVANQNNTSQQYMSGVAAANGLTLDGQKIKVAGLGDVLQAQTSVYNASQGDSGAGIWGALGQVGGAALSKYSDRRLKRNIRRVGTHALGIGLYEFDYVWGEHSAGVMADEVMKVKPEAVTAGDGGYLMVNYGML